MSGRPALKSASVLALFLCPGLCIAQSWEQSDFNDQLTHSAPAQQDLQDEIAKGDFAMFDTEEIKKNLYSGSLLYQL
eukprot:4864014-Pyramimonas_sp.AAC.1